MAALVASPSRPLPGSRSLTAGVATSWLARPRCLQFRLFDPGAFGRAFEAFLDDSRAAGVGILTIVGRRPCASRSTAPQAVCRYTLSPPRKGCADGDWVEGRRKVRERILASRTLLATLSLDGLLVAGYAMHALTGTTAKVLVQGGDYIFALKDNRPAEVGPL